MKTIVLCVHGLTTASLGCFGNERRPTPCIDRLCKQAVVFDQHFASVPSVAGARHALLRGRHCIPPLGNGAAADRSGTDVRSVLRERGMPSFVVTDQPADFTTGWDRVFDDVESALEALDAVDGGLLWLEESLLPPWSVPDEALAQLFSPEEEENSKLEPWLDPNPGMLWAADDSDYQRLQRTFAAVVQDWDHRFGALVDMLDAQPWFVRSLFAVASGRGQALGEHGMGGDHRPWLHEELVHVPLVVRLPDTEQGGRRVFHLTQSVDVPATIADAMGANRPDDWLGRSLMPLCRGAGPIHEYIGMGLELGGATEFGLRTANECVLLPDRAPVSDPVRAPMYFVKPDDRWEVNNLRQPNLDRAEALEATLRAYVTASSQPEPIAIPQLPSSGE